MNKATLFAVSMACVGLGLFVSAFSAGSNVAIFRWPLETLHGLAFTFAWGLGFPDYLAYTAGVLVLAAVMLIFYMMGKKIYSLIWRN
ncbi:hypothetical protein [Vibrio renipiscarius]|uniref:Membrane protein n=1 Tax=Vibrio renipiscarius TaxID=1461322 RepID=A0A0C2NMK5_9VIBR|nr:hypothetical protein [Vibrio renipiscarius]KII75267.1 membrane protein [Vibrio renipiscarius]KII78719.1 membrane protein [Vibrio renipiscarius]